ncbi:MAG TPA: HAMP domain-containing protein, partial [Candidatus Nitrosotenuis sp.]|nr:HAMP domain-containing protein [Candidatus Nitrosotenuis sp.]
MPAASDVPAPPGGGRRRVDPLRRSILGIFLWIALAFILLVATLSYGMVKAQALSFESQRCTLALLAAERVRRGESAVEIPPLQGKDALEMALLEGDREGVQRAVARYEQAALQGLLSVERQRARLFHLQVAVALVLMAAALSGLVGLLYWTYGTILRPIEALGRLAAEVRQGNLQDRAPAFSQPEFDQLGRAMNEMLDSLQGRLAELTRNQKDWEELISALPQALVVVDAEGRVLSANPAAHRLLGAESLQGRPAAELLPLDGGLQERRATLPLGSGESIPVLLRPVPLEGRPGVLWCLQDLRPEEKLEKLRQEALSTVLRELRAPVTGLAELAEASGRSELAAQARQVLEMVDNLALADQMRRGRWQCRRELLQLDELLAQVVRAHEAPAREREVLLECQAQPAPVLGDRPRLRLALHHLLGRLLEASPAGGKVSLSCWTARGRVLLEMVPDEPEPAAGLRRWLSRPAV